jgi:NAD(P)H dehydrogenase (quinone)
MNVLIVHAHNEPQSFTSAMKDLAVAEFAAQGCSVEVSDLYAMHWNPLASADDFGSRANPDYLTYALEQRHNHTDRTLAADIQEELDKLLRADLVIFSFPLYWFSMPAIMKGWFDRVLVSGVCYGGKRFYDQGGLKGKKALLAFTCGGRPHMLVEGGIHGPINEMLRPILRGTLAYTGMTVLPPFVGYHIPYLKPEQRTEILEQYRKYLQGLDLLVPLEFPAMSAFDEQLNPLV